MFDVTQKHPSHSFIGQQHGHTLLMDDGRSGGELLQLYRRPRSICCFASPPPTPLKPPPSIHTITTTISHTCTHTCAWKTIKRKERCLIQLLKSCLACVSRGGCTSVARSFIRPYSRTLKAPGREMINTLYYLKRARKKMDEKTGRKENGEIEGEKQLTGH